MNLRFHCLLTLGVLLSVLPLSAQTAPEGPPRNAPRIQWDGGTLSLIQSNANYARIIRLNDGQLLCGFDVQGKVQVRHSSDDGKTWRDPIKVAEWPFGHLTNTEVLQLRDGSLLCFYNRRPHRRPVPSNPDGSQPEGAHLYAVCMARSDDHGQTAIVEFTFRQRQRHARGRVASLDRGCARDMEY